MSSVAQKEFVDLQKARRKSAKQQGIKVYQSHYGDEAGKKNYELAVKLMGRNSKSK